MPNRHESHTLENLSNMDFWLTLNPDMKITKTPFEDSGDSILFSSAEQQSLAQHMAVDGYFQTSSVFDVDELTQLKNIILTLHANNVMPLFAAVYDEFWQIIVKLRQCYSSILGTSYRLSPDFWIFYINQGIDSAGWGAHRDAEFKAEDLNESGLPDLLTVWIPLTNVTTHDSCIYVVPRTFDETYMSILKGDQRNSLEIGTCVQLNQIRALPVSVGAMLGWDATLAHWGSPSSQWATSPRISIGIYYESNKKETITAHYDQNRRYIEHDNLHSSISFEDRLRIISNIIDKYQYKFETNNGASEEHYSPLIKQFASRWRWKS